MANRYQYELPEHDVLHGQTLQVDKLKIDPQAQRTLNERRAQKIADDLVKEAVGSIIVSERSNGEQYIVDGMHRHRAFQLCGYQEITGEVHRGLNQTQEAILFLIKNRESNKPGAIDEYKIGLTAGIPLFVDTDKVLSKMGLSMGSSSTNSIGAVAGTLRVVDTYGPEVLARTLKIAEGAWARNAATWDGVIIEGLGRAIGKHGDMIEDSAFVKKLAKSFTAQSLVGKVHSLASGGGFHNSGTGSRAQTCYKLLIDTWNKGRKPENRIAND